MIQDFLHGGSYIAKGWKAFYGDKRAWKFALFPFLIMFIFYAFAAWGIFYLFRICSEKLTAVIQELPDWISWLGAVASGIISLFSFLFIILFLAATICTFYEFFGGLFFDSLTAYYEKKEFNTTPRAMTFRENLRYTWDSFCWGIRVVIIFCALFILSSLLPIVGPVLLIGIMGYFFGISYMICSANNNHVSIEQLKLICSQKLALVAGFGVTAYLLLSIPFVAIFLLPALVLGGSELFNTHLKK